MALRVVGAQREHGLTDFCSLLEKTLRDARRAGLLRSKDYAAVIEEALGQGVISPDDAAELERMEILRREVIMVDSFAQYGKRYALTATQTKKPAIYAV